MPIDFRQKKEYHIFNDKNRLIRKTPLHVEKGLFLSCGERDLCVPRPKAERRACPRSRRLSGMGFEPLSPLGDPYSLRVQVGTTTIIVRSGMGILSAAYKNPKTIGDAPTTGLNI